MSWHGNEYRQSSERGRQRLTNSASVQGRDLSPAPAPGLVRRLAWLGGFCLVAAAGCAVSPAVTPSGLPKIGRYASPAQLDWMLGRYQALGQVTPGSDAELHEEACLGWERAVFDLQSGRRYPTLLRMSNETTNLENLWQDLPLLARRHPRPSSCAEAAPVAQVVAPSGSAGAPQVASSQSAATDPVATPGETGQGVTTQGDSAAVGPVVASGTAVSTENSASASPSAPPAVAAAPARSASLVVRQRRQLARLRAALGMPLEPSVREGEAANSQATRNEPGPDRKPTPSPELDDAALQVLLELAQSDLPPVSLRARFHLLGLCTLAVEAADRYLFEPDFGSTQPWSSSPLSQASQKVCGLRNPGESLRQGQGRLLWSLLRAWRVKYPEPMGDIVIGLASFAGRDNPVVDGPRVSR